MNPLRTRLGLLAVTTAALVAPSVAAAENLVPPDNSAVNQYTESFPTAGGDKDSEKAKEKGVTPAKTLGAKNAKKLAAQGEDGQVVAEVAAETAPVSATPDTSASESAPAGDGGKGKDSDTKADQQEADAGPDSGGGGAAGPGDGGGGGATAAGGSSGAGAVLGQATGFSDGQMGLLFPLVLLAGLAWALAFLWRRRDQPTA